MRWQKAMWDAVSTNDADLIRDILKLKQVRRYLSRNREQVYLDEEAPLHLAAYSGQNDLIRVLVVEGGFDVDSYNVYSDKSGFRITPLHFAAYKNKVGTVKYLLSLGADASLYGKWGEVNGTALEFARRRKNKEVAEILRKSEEEEEIDEMRQLRLAEDVFDDAEVVKRAEEAEAKVRSLSRQLDEAKFELKSLKSKLFPENSNSSNANFSAERKCCCCVVCLMIPPKKIYSCGECDQIMCNGCRSRLTSCPCCRIEFDRTSPRRNRWAEKFVEVTSTTTTMTSTEGFFKKTLN